jgi:serine/threonine protein kinase
LKLARPGVTVEAEALSMQRLIDRPGDPDRPAGAAGPVGEPDSCLDEQEVVDFVGGVLPSAGLTRVERHLAGCDRCTALVTAAVPHVAAATAVSPTQVTASVETKPIDPYLPGAPGALDSPPHLSRLRGERPRLAAGTPLDATYQVVRFLGRGGMGDVYEVKHARLAGRYAAKLLSVDLANNAQAFSRFQREAMIASGLSHPNIVNVIDFCHLPDGLPCLVMEYLDGVDLADVMSRGALSLARTLRLVRQIVSALGTLHGHEIIHRDLKPQNIFVLPESEGQAERVKLVDFGLAKRSNPSLVVTNDRALLGTPQYMAPEQAIGNGIGPESDQFSLAAIVYEMLAGRHPFAGEVLSTVLYRIVHEPPAPLSVVAPDVPLYVGAAIERALSKERQARFPSVKELLQALEGEGMPTDPAPITTKQRRSWFVRREVLASAGVLLAAAGIVGVFRVMRHPPDPPVWHAGSEPGAAQVGPPAPKVPVAPQGQLTIERPTTSPPVPVRAAAVVGERGAPPEDPSGVPTTAPNIAGKEPPIRTEKRRRGSEGRITAGTPSTPPVVVPAETYQVLPTAPAAAAVEPPAPAIKPPPILIEKL